MWSRGRTTIFIWEKLTITVSPGGSDPPVLLLLHATRVPKWARTTPAITHLIASSLAHPPHERGSAIPFLFPPRSCAAYLPHRSLAQPSSAPNNLLSDPHPPDSGPDLAAPAPEQHQPPRGCSSAASNVAKVAAIDGFSPTFEFASVSLHG